ncbi:MAG: dockerin type I domain-containing protein, partial [Euryarchaeota archaeon]|nr:dockerin type I domain-containing protein [Euryarchaeota archaeon]
TVDPRSIAISAVQYDLYYNTSVIRAEWANPGPLLKQGGADTDVVVLTIDNRWDIENKVGKISYAETILGSGDDTLPSVNTSGTITTICFSAIGAVGTSSYLDFGNVKISDPDKLDVPCCIATTCDNEAPVAVAKSMYRVSNAASTFQCFAALCCCNSYGGCDAGAGETITYVRWDFGDGEYETSQDLGDCQKHHEYMTWNWIGGETGHYVNFTAYLTVMDGGCPPGSNTTSVGVAVYIAGDTNGDGKVDIYDAACVGKRYGQTAIGPTATCVYYWTDSQADGADLNNDGRVSTLDLMIVGTNWNHLAYPPYYVE